jgi:hypothetical protein
MYLISHSNSNPILSFSISLILSHSPLFLSIAVTEAAILQPITVPEATSRAMKIIKTVQNLLMKRERGRERERIAIKIISLIVIIVTMVAMVPLTLTLTLTLTLPL